MAESGALHTAVLDRLADHASDVTVYDGVVASSPPSDSSGRVFPYAVVWRGPGTYPGIEAETLAASDRDREALRWVCRVTVAAGKPSWLGDAVSMVRTALLGYRPSRLSGRLSDEGTEPVMNTDRDITPVRYYVPLVFEMMAP